MSHSLYFYKISKITDDLPEIINTDKMSFPYYDVHAEDAADWEKDIGLFRTIEYSSVDMFSAAEKLYGKKPKSICPSHSYYTDPDGPFAEVEMLFPDGDKKRVHRSEIEKFRYNKQYQACIYNRDDIARVEDGYMVESKAYENRHLSKDDVLEMAERFIRDHENDYEYSYNSIPLFEIMKAYFAVNDGDCIICHSE